MANKRYDQFATVTPTTSRIILHADAATGNLGKCTIADELDLITSTPTLLQQLQMLGCPFKSISYGINPSQVSGTANWQFTATNLMWNYVPATTLTGVWFYQNVIGNYTASGFNGVGIYSSSGGTLTLQRQSANDPNIFKTGATQIKYIPFTSTITVTAGIYWAAVQPYGTGLITTPSCNVVNGTGFQPVNQIGFTHGEKLYTVDGTSGAMPTPILWSTLPVSNAIFYICGFY